MCFLKFFIVIQFHCGFDLHFPNDYWHWAPFNLPVDHLYISFVKYLWKCFVQSLIGWFVFFLLSIGGSLYILDINLLLHKLFANIFSYFIDFYFVNYFLCCADFKKFHVVSFMFAFGVKSKKKYLQGVYHICFLLDVFQVQVLFKF